MVTLEQIKNLLLPELQKVNDELHNLGQRMTSLEQHQIDQSRRIDAVREELSSDIRAVREELGGEIRETNRRLDAVRDELVGDIRKTNDRLDRLYEVIVRRDEHDVLQNRVIYLEQQVQDIKLRLAA